MPAKRVDAKSKGTVKGDRNSNIGNQAPSQDGAGDGDFNSSQACRSHCRSEDRSDETMPRKKRRLDMGGAGERNLAERAASAPVNHTVAIIPYHKSTNIVGSTAKSVQTCSRSFKKALNIDTDTDSLIDGGWACYEEEKYDEALEHFQQSLFLERRQHGDSSKKIIDCLWGVAVCYTATGELDHALRYYRKLATLISKRYGTCSEAMFVMKSQMGKALQLLNHFEEALKAYHAALDIGRAVLGSDDEHVATILTSLGSTYIDVGDLDSALRFSRQALKIQLSVESVCSVEVQRTYEVMARVHRKRTEHAEALDCYRKILAIKKENSGDPLRISEILCDIADIYRDLEQPEKAVECYGEVLALQKEQSADPLRLAQTLISLAYVHQEQKQFSKSIERYEEALEIQRTHGADRIVIAKTLRSIGVVKHLAEDFEGALDVQQECLVIRREIHGEITSDVAEILILIGRTLSRLEKQDIALGAVSEAYRVIQCLDTNCTELTALVLNEIATILFDQGREEQALCFYHEVINVEGGVMGQRGLSLSRAYAMMGVIYYRRCEIELTVDTFNQVLLIEKQLHGIRNKECALALGMICNVELQRGNVEEAMRSYVESARIFRALGESDAELEIDNVCLHRFNILHPPAAGAA